MTSFEGGGVPPTPTLALHVALPPAPVTVAVYRVEEVGETDLVPAAIGVIAPTPWLMVPEVAFVLVQESVDELPAVMEAGCCEGAGGSCWGYDFLKISLNAPPGDAPVPVYLPKSVVCCLGGTSDNSTERS